MKKSAAKKGVAKKAAATRSAATKRARSAKEVGPIRAFKTQQDFKNWLDKNHGMAGGVWVRFGKKGSGIKSITHPEALEVALCYGWIDALRLPETGKTYLQRFLPRRPKSLWSKINRDKVLALMQSGRMHAAGLAEIERAQSDGRWAAAYDSPSRATVPAELQRELDRNPTAKEFFDKLDRVNRYAIIWRIQTARTPATREGRMRTLIDMLEKGKKLH